LSLTLREEHRLRVTENRVLRRIFGPEREEVAGGWRRLHNEALHKLYASPCYQNYQSKEKEMNGEYSTHGTYEKYMQNFGLKVRREETTRNT
jgi:hypothetical protein